MASFTRYKDQSGQIGLIVLLIGAVLMTIGIGAVSQSIIETKTATQEVISSQAFNAAEQGIEYVLSGPLTPVDSAPIQNLPPGFSGNFSVTEQDSYNSTILMGHSADINLNGATTPLILSWTVTSTGCGGAGHPALIVTLINSTGSNLTRTAYTSGTSCSDNFTNVSCPSNVCSISIPVAGYAKARVKVVYDDTSLSTNTLGATQAFLINAQVKNDNSSETRAVSATKTNPAVSGIFDYALFSGLGDINQ